MRANDPTKMDERLANWIARLMQTHAILRDPAHLKSFFAFIAEEDIKTIIQLTELFEEWRGEEGGIPA